MRNPWMLGWMCAMTGAAGAATGDLPNCLPDWKLEVVAGAPRVRHPSVVCCAPDGRVFVAEDPMDISAPSADLSWGRILCFHSDGRVTVFAENLYAVFGMQYLEGKLYVLHNPKFSVFTDDNGVGRARQDLIESTHPNPWALEWNDHVPANFKLGMDGYFYLAVGDKGMYGAVGRDGKRLDLHGGGVVRLRPDATQLEIFSTGVRNILDVALTAEDELFTYDNTDEQQWMSRVTHMVDGGFYGYPYDFLPRRPYTLWMMADYGPGAATGTLAYNEDALPPEYHGALFLADFGKRQLLWVRTRREGASFAVVSRQDFFTDIPPDFRPVGIALAPDGLSFYICDWNHADTKDKVEVGRLLKLSYTGRSQAKPKPSWHRAAAMGRPFEATDAELIAGLAHPARSVRLTAQRSLVKRAAPGLPRAAPGPARTIIRRLGALLADSQAPPPARWHALWALDAIDGGAAEREVILKAANDPEVSIRRQAIRQLGTRRAQAAAGVLEARLKDPEASVRFHAATALGRLGEGSAIASLEGALADGDPVVRYAAFTALNRIGRSNRRHWPAIVRGLASSTPVIRENTGHALREVYDPALVAALKHFSGDASQTDEGRAAALRLLGGLARKRPEWKGDWWAYHPVNAPPPAKSESWRETDSILATLRAALEGRDRSIRAAAIEAIRAARDLAAVPRLAELFKKETDWDERRRFLEALGDLPCDASAALVREILQNLDRYRSLTDDVVAAAVRLRRKEFVAPLVELARPGRADQVKQVLDLIGTIRDGQDSAVVIGFLRHPDPEVRLAAAETLEKIQGKAAAGHLLALLGEDSPDMRRTAVVALGRLRAREAVDALLDLHRKNELLEETTVALAQIRDPRAVSVYLDGLASKTAAVRTACAEAIRLMAREALPEIETRLGGRPPEIIGQLQQIYSDHTQARRGPLFRRDLESLPPADYLEFASNHKGDAERGRQLFNDTSALACLQCHAIKGQGGKVGPDLAGSGSRFSRRELIESILYPSKQVREGYQAVTIETTDGEEYSGLVVAENAEKLTLRDAAGGLHSLDKSALKKRSNSATSLMPEGLHAALGLEAFADLIAYVESLKE